MITIEHLITTAIELGEVHRKNHKKVVRMSKDVPRGQNPDLCTVDLSCDKIIKKKFGKKGLGINVLTEESAFEDNGSDYTLYGDGLDGTSFYLMGKRYSCASLGLKYKKELVMGVIYNGMTRQLYVGVKGAGSYIFENGSTRQLETKKTTEIKDIALALPTMKVMMSNDKYADIFRKAVKATWRFGCEGSLALNLCDIADGQYDTIIVPDTVGGPWDFAAGVVILREAGGYAGDWERNKFDINKPTPFLGASSKHIYNLVQKTFFGGDKQ